MKSFDELREFSADPEVLEERNLVRKGAGLMYARQSKTHGDAATKHFSAATNHLNRPADSVEDQLTNLTNAMKEMSSGMMRMRDQGGSITALCLVTVLLNERQIGIRR